MLVTSEMLLDGHEPLLFLGGACNVQGPEGPERNPGRDPLARWLDERGWSYFDPQIHPSTHGRGYAFEIDGRQEGRARAVARLRLYEILPVTHGSVTMLEVLDDARRGRDSVVWFHGGREFVPTGLGDLPRLRRDTELRERLGEQLFHHLVAYVGSGRHLRRHMEVMVGDSPHVVLVDSLSEVKRQVEAFLG